MLSDDGSGNGPIGLLGSEPDPVRLAEARLRQVCTGRSALLLEDDVPFARRMIEALKSAGFGEVRHVENGDAALDAARRAHFDVLILDRENPGMEGLEVVRQLRTLAPSGANSAASPVLIVTSFGERDERIQAFLSGARFDDYVPKQYVDWEELLARVAAQIERFEGSADGPIRYGAFAIDASLRRLDFGTRPIRLSRREFDIMFALLSHRGRPVTRNMLWDRCWTEWKFTPDDHVNIINTALSRLRRKLAGQLPPTFDAADAVIVNIWSQGLAVRLIETDG
jgi:DNA-binding response OmpR family regulator